MKKRIRCLLLVFLFCLVLCVSVAAAEQTGAQLSYVTDAAGLLSENENMLLEKMAESVSQKVWCRRLHRNRGGLSGLPF